MRFWQLLWLLSIQTTCGFLVRDDLLGGTCRHSQQRIRRRTVQTPKSEQQHSPVLPLRAIHSRHNHHQQPSLNTESSNTIPFLIEKLPIHPSNLIFSEIANMCIDAFFNDSTSILTPLWKQLQLNFLRKLQTADLERRRRREPYTNVMLVARSVVPATRERTEYTPLILNLEGIYHRERLSTNDVVRGNVLGFVEVTMKPYGLGDADNEGESMTATTATPLRPVLTNLSVVKSARRSGVGSALMRACEDTVSKDWKLDEIILEVEDDNENAIRFYESRGYNVLFADTTARRYDVNGLFLQQKRCTRLVMRKRFFLNSSMPVLSMFQKLRDTYLAVVESR